VPPVFDAREGYAVARLAKCDYFTIDVLDIATAAVLTADEGSFHALLCTEGDGVLRYGNETVSYRRGDALFLPAGLGEYTLQGASKMLVTTV
jgi:mannose-6-phosphate isomerase